MTIDYSVAALPDMEKLKRISAPKHLVLADFIHGCSADANTRTVAVASLTTTLWQLAGPGMTLRPPSLLLLNATGSETDLVNGFTARVIAGTGDSDPDQGKRSDSTGEQSGLQKMAIAEMEWAILMKQELGNPTPQNKHQHQMVQHRFDVAQKTGFGTGRSRPYATAWHERFGLLTDHHDAVILRLENGDDCLAFSNDLLKAGAKLLNPIGYGSGVALVEKHVAVLGSMPPSIWDDRTAGAIVNLGLPFIPLPHCVNEAPVFGNFPALDYFTMQLHKVFRVPLEEPARLPPNPWFELYGSYLRKRLRELPGTYEYVMQRAVRQLFTVCRRLAIQADYMSRASADEIETLTFDLSGHTLRAMVIATAGLAWHLLGFDPGINRDRAAKALAKLRRKGPMTLSKLLVAARLTKTERDALVERLAAEDLIRVEGKQVRATTYAEFVAELYARKEFPAPVNHWEQVEKTG